MESFVFNEESYVKFATREFTRTCRYYTFYIFLWRDRMWPERAKWFSQYCRESYPASQDRKDELYRQFCLEVCVVVQSFRYRPDLIASLFSIPHLPLQYAIHNISHALIEQDAVEILQLYKEHGYPLKPLATLRSTSGSTSSSSVNFSFRENSTFDMTTLLQNMPRIRRKRRATRRYRRSTPNFLAQLLRKEHDGAETAGYIVYNNALEMAEFYRDELIIPNTVLFECAFQARNLSVLRITKAGFNDFKEDKKRDIIFLAEAMIPDTGPDGDQNHIILYDDLRKLYGNDVEENQRDEVLAIVEANGNYFLWLYLQQLPRGMRC